MDSPAQQPSDPPSESGHRSASAAGGFWRIRRILPLALPIIGGMTSQNLLNLVDTAMVSRLGDAALASVGMASFALFMSSAFVTGLSAGVQAMSARRHGEGRKTETAIPLNGGLLVAAGVAVPLVAVLYLAAPWIFSVLTPDAEVGRLATSYYQIRLWGIPAMGMNFAFRGYWNAVDRSGLYLRTILVMHVVNIVLDWALIFGELGAPELGVDGAALASIAAFWTGTILYSIQCLRKASAAGFLRGLPQGSDLSAILRTSLPAGTNQFSFAFSMTTFFWIIGQLGTAEMAASNVLVNLLLVALLPSIGFGLASATLVGQALGQRDVGDARRWAWDVIKTALPVMAGCSVVGLLFPDFVLGFFLHNPDTLQLARGPLQLIAVTLPFDAVRLVLINSIQGAGDSRRVLMVSSFMQWVVFLPLAWLLGPFLQLGLLATWAAQSFNTVVTALVFTKIWRGGSWAGVKM